MTEALRLPSLFTDHMVLQRDRALPIWGWAKPQTTVSVTLAGQSRSALADSTGRWQVAMPALPAGGPHEMVVASAAESIKISDVLVGEVWVCSGQSNMEWPLASARDGERESANANHPQIRLYNVPRVASMTPSTDIDTRWTACTPENARGFSAVAYFFGRQLQQTLGVPIGLINTSWGGTAVECWIPREALAADASIAYLLDKVSTFHAEAAVVPHDDPGNTGAAMGFASETFDDAAWKAMSIPCTWHSTGLDIDGSVWFRRTVDLPPDFAGKDLQLNPGVLNDFDHTYFNGELVGATGKETPDWWTVAREYTVPGKLVKAGRNTIAIRVFNQWAFGGMMGPENLMRAFPVGEPARAIPLAGDWRYEVELALPHRMPAGQSTPTLLYNAMIAPLIPGAIRGAIWYQGESNASRAAQYRTLFPLMIQTWRSRWGQGDFPFLFVQLANYQSGLDSGAASPWAELREAQSRTLALPNTGQAVIIDIGEDKDIHPRNKLDVGLRLAHEAMRVAYGQEAPRSPVFESLRIEKDRAIVTFAHAPGGLVSRDEPAEFALAGADGVFHPAAASIDGAKVILTSPVVPAPVSVRYGWSQCPRCNLFSRDGLPVCPFRTDDLPLSTANAR